MGVSETSNNRHCQPATEERTVPPVASGVDVFEMYGCLMVAEGRMSETRMRRAVEAYRKVVAQ